MKIAVLSFCLVFAPHIQASFFARMSKSIRELYYGRSASNMSTLDKTVATGVGEEISPVLSSGADSRDTGLKSKKPMSKRPITPLEAADMPTSEYMMGTSEEVMSITAHEDVLPKGAPERREINIFDQLHYVKETCDNHAFLYRFEPQTDGLNQTDAMKIVVVDPMTAADLMHTEYRREQREKASSNTAQEHVVPLPEADHAQSSAPEEQTDLGLQVGNQVQPTSVSDSVAIDADASPEPLTIPTSETEQGSVPSPTGVPEQEQNSFHVEVDTDSLTVSRDRPLSSETFVTLGATEPHGNASTEEVSKSPSDEIGQSSGFITSDETEESVSEPPAALNTFESHGNASTEEVSKSPSDEIGQGSSGFITSDEAEEPLSEPLVVLTTPERRESTATIANASEQVDSTSPSEVAYESDTETTETPQGESSDVEVPGTPGRSISPTDDTPAPGSPTHSGESTTADTVTFARRRTTETPRGSSDPSAPVPLLKSTPWYWLGYSSDSELEDVYTLFPGVGFTPLTSI
jgi:hypothetical protein